MQISIRSTLASLPLFLGLIMTATTPHAQMQQAFAPTGSLRASINLGNPILANKDAAGKPIGVSVDLATELAKRLGLPLELVVFDAANQSMH